MGNLIGREGELNHILQFFDFDITRPKLVTLHGPGGIGKTAIQKALLERFKSQSRYITTDLIDLIEARLSNIRFLRAKIAASLDPNRTFFEEYYHYINELDIQLGRKVDTSQVLEVRKKAEESFLSSYESLITERGVSVIIFLDTMEVIDLYRSEWESNIIPFLSQLPATHFIMAGREGNRWRPLINSQFFNHDELSITIVGLNLEETRQYFNQSPTGRDTLDELVEKVFLLSDGRPILIDLAIEWNRRKLSFSNLSKLKADYLQSAIAKSKISKKQTVLLELVDGSKVTLGELSKQFELQLIENILELPARSKIPILSMVYLQQTGVTPSLLDRIANNFLSKKETGQELFNELKEFVFIKLLPNNQLVLHDEAKRMIEEYKLWNRFDGTGEIRYELFSLLESYFDCEAEQLENRLTSNENTSYTEIENINQDIYKLRSQQLHFTFNIDMQSGFNKFKVLFERSSNKRMFLISEGLLEVAKSHPLNHPQLTEVNLTEIDFLFDSAAYEKAEKIIRKMLENPNVSPSVQIELYFDLGYATIKLGRGVPLARKYYQEALNISEEESISDPQPKLLNELGYLHRLQGNLKEAVRHYELAYHKAKENGNVTEEISSLINWSFVDSRLAEYSQGHEKLKLVWELLGTQVYKDQKLVGRYYSVLGEVVRYEGKFFEAIEAYNNALKQFTAPEDEAWPGLIVSQRGVVYLNMFISSPEKVDIGLRAKEDLASSVEMCRRSNKNVLPMALHRYGRYFQAVKDYQSAIQIFREGYQIGKLQDDWQFIVENLTNLSEVLFYQWEETHDSELATEVRENFAEIEKLQSSGFSFPHLFGKMQQILANILILTEQYQEALDLYVKSIQNLSTQEIFVGRDRLDNRLREIEPLLLNIPIEWQKRWWHMIYEVASRINFEAQPEIMTYLSNKNQQHC